jgi:hypothetical protein
MRSLGPLSVAAALCVCCVLPSYDAVDSLPGEGEGATSSGANSSSGGKSNLTSTTGGKNNGSSGSGVGAEGGDDPMGTSGSGGTGGSDPGTGGMDTGGTPTTGGTPPGGSPPSGGAGGSPVTGGSGGSPATGGSGGSGGSPATGGAGGAMSGKPECNVFCSGANGLLVRCEGYLGADIASEAGCQAVCNAAPATSLNCWQTHLDNVIAGLSAAVHCNHASGKAGNGVCPDRPMP